MLETRLFRLAFIGLAITLGSAFTASAQTEFGPVVTSYLGYLRNEQEVVDDRISKHEVTSAYYRRNSNRIRALRQTAIRIARETNNDYLPEMEAVAGDEAQTLFEHPPRFQTLRVGEVVQTTFRYLGVVRSGEPFYVFARLDPYEQADLMQRTTQSPVAGSPISSPISGSRTTRSRRVSTP
ncbi:MAG: hypothetical protein ABJC10_03335 [Acidobacteriota bacterium]